MKAEHIIIKNADSTIEECKTIRARVKDLLEKHNRKAMREWTGDDSTLRYMKHYRFLQKDMARAVTDKEFEHWLVDKMIKYNDGNTEPFSKNELMKDLLWEVHWLYRLGQLDGWLN